MTDPDRNVLERIGIINHIDQYVLKNKDRFVQYKSYPKEELQIFIERAVRQDNKAFLEYTFFADGGKREVAAIELIDLFGYDHLDPNIEFATNNFKANLYSYANLVLLYIIVDEIVEIIKKHD